MFYLYSINKTYDYNNLSYCQIKFKPLKLYFEEWNFCIFSCSLTTWYKRISIWRKPSIKIEGFGIIEQRAIRRKWFISNLKKKFIKNEGRPIKRSLENIKREGAARINLTKKYWRNQATISKRIVKIWNSDQQFDASKRKISRINLALKSN